MGVINKAINDVRLVYLKDTSLLKSSPRCDSKRVYFLGLCYWKGRMFFARALRLLHLLVKKEMLDLGNLSTR